MPDIDDMQEAKDLIDDEFADAFADFDKFDEVINTLVNDADDLDMLIKDSAYGSWDLSELSNASTAEPNLEEIEGATEQSGYYEDW